jgi:hypothetical protein
MGYLEPSAANGANVTMQSNETGTSFSAVTTDRAFYDPDRERVRS